MDASPRSTGLPSLPDSTLDRFPEQPTADQLGRALQVLVHSHVRPFAGRNDREGRFPSEGIAALGQTGLLGLTIPERWGGLGLGPRAVAQVVAALAEEDASLAMVYVMHLAGTACLVGSPHTARFELVLRDVANGKHLTTLAFSEKGSRSHFWSPISRAERTHSGIRIQARKSWVTSAGHANSLVVSTLAAAAKSPVETDLYLVDGASEGVRVSAPWNGLGLRGNSSSPVDLDTVTSEDRRLTEEGQGFPAMLSWVLPIFSLGCSAMSLGLARAAVRGTTNHLKESRLEHLDQSLGQAFPNLRARLASMEVETQGISARVDQLVGSIEHPNDGTMLAVLGTKAGTNEAAIRVTSDAMRACGGSAYSGHTSIDRLFRDAHAGAVMAPTVDQVQDFVGRALLGMPLM